MCVCVCVCAFLDRPDGGSKTIENMSNAAVELRLSAQSPGWRLLAALLCRSSLTIIRYRAAIFMTWGGVMWFTIIAPFTCCCTNNSAVASTTAVRVFNTHHARSAFWEHHLVFEVSVICISTH